jgi:hypothetical protein
MIVAGPQKPELLSLNLKDGFIFRCAVTAFPSLLLSLCLCKAPRNILLPAVATSLTIPPTPQYSITSSTQASECIQPIKKKNIFSE